MKKIMIMATGALLFAASTTFAQQDTTRRQQSQPRQQQTQPTNPTGIRPTDDNDMQGWSRVNTADIPATLRTTLGDSKYEGWESSTIYRNDRDNTYRIAITDDNNKSTTYYFDRNGKATNKPNKRNN